jgi:hypothetical protein
MSLSRLGVCLAALLLGVGEAHAAWVDTAFWPFNELTGTVADDAVGTHDGTISGGVALGASGQNGHGTSFRFVGNGRVVIPNMGTLSPGSNWMEASIRIKTTNVPTTGDFNLFRSGAFETTQGFKIELLPDGRASCAFKGSAGHVNNVTGGTSVATNQWKFIQCILRRIQPGMDEIILAVNGVIAARKLKPIGEVTLTLNGIVAHYSATAATGGYIGRADEPRIRVCETACTLPASP